MIDAFAKQLLRKWSALIAAWNVEGMRAACRENDANGNFDDATAEELAEILVEWMKDVCS